MLTALAIYLGILWAGAFCSVWLLVVLGHRWCGINAARIMVLLGSAILGGVVPACMLITSLEYWAFEPVTSMIAWHLGLVGLMLSAVLVGGRSVVDREFSRMCVVSALLVFISTSLALLLIRVL